MTRTIMFAAGLLVVALPGIAPAQHPGSWERARACTKRCEDELGRCAKKCSSIPYEKNDEYSACYGPCLTARKECGEECVKDL